MAAQAGLTVTPLRTLPMFGPEMAIAEELTAAVEREGEQLRDGDVLVLAQKIVSKCEGRIVRLSDVHAGEEAQRIATETGRAPELVQLILDESSAIMRATPAVIITRHRTGHVLANAGIDASNVEGGAQDMVLLWPSDPDASARVIRAELMRLCGVRPAIVIADSLGRAWRIGTAGTAIGCAGLTVLDDQRGGMDLFGRVLQATVIGVADSIAAAAVLAMGEGAEGTPAAIVRGADRWLTDEDGPGAVAALRPLKEDLFQ